MIDSIPMHPSNTNQLGESVGPRRIIMPSKHGGANPTVLSPTSSINTNTNTNNAALNY